jgi:glycosyltransferase involved in cell wall biosynthesis
MVGKSKVLFLIHLPPPVHGSSLLGSQVYNSEIIHQSFEAKFINLLLSTNVNSTGNFGLGKLWKSLIITSKLLFELIFHYPQICYFALSASGFALIRDLILVILLKIFNVPIVFHLHNKGIKHNRRKRLYGKVYNFIFSGNKVIVGSKLLYQDVEEYFSFDSVYLCPNGIMDCESQLGIKKNDRTTILYLSNLIKSKGILDLLESCKILHENKVDFILQIVGSEGDLSISDIQSRVNGLGISSQVDIIGPRFGLDKLQILNNADIFVFPTYYRFECFPLSLIEAMQFSLPIISTFEGGIPDLIEDGFSGFLVNQRDVEEISNRLMDLILNPELRVKMGNAGKRLYEHNYTTKLFQERIKNILEVELNHF